MSTAAGQPMSSFREALHTQRWDDHRYYHHSRINQTLHLVSALSFLAAYVMLFVDPVMSAWLAWMVAMTTRQAGHFFFEPKGYDHVNEASHEFKEEIKVGYNLRRKVVLLTIWALLPLALLLDRDLFGLFQPHQDTEGFLRNLGWSWLWLGFAALLFRVLQLAFSADLRTGVVWLTKILTDPFHDVKLYHRAPIHLLKGELIDPMHARH
jgi:hypothetical protein